MCYAIPLAAAAVTSLVWRRSRNVKVWWLNLMFYGGALFGVIDHCWNGELFLVGKNAVKDLLLGVTIALGTLIAWVLIITLVKVNPTLASDVNART